MINSSFKRIGTDSKTAKLSFQKKYCKRIWNLKREERGLLVKEKSIDSFWKTT